MDVRIAVVYYSLSGHTAKLGQMIADRLHARRHVIHDQKPRAGMFGVLRSIWKTLLGTPAAIKIPDLDPDDFDLVIVGGPMWVGRASSPLQTYLRTLKGTRPNVAFFMTHGGPEVRDAFETMAELCDKRPTATFSATEHQVEVGVNAVKLDEFLAAVTLLPQPESPGGLPNVHEDNPRG